MNGREQQRSLRSEAVAPPRQSATGGIRVIGLWKTYERVVGAEVIRTHAVRGFNLDVAPKEFVSIVGPSGCGKTTVLKVIAGLLTPSKGEVWIGEQRVRGPGTDRATVFQYPGLMPWRSVMDNVVLALEFARVPRSERRERAIRYIDLVGLSDFHEHFPGELSGGMQQRVGLARALAIEPQVLLMDEPFGALDAITRTKMQTELLSIWEREKKTVLFVTHSIDEAILLSDRVIVMKNDLAAQEGMIAEEVIVPIDRPRSRDVLLEDPVAIELKRRFVSLL